MPQQIAGVLGRLTDAVKQFTLAQKTLAVIGLAVLVLGLAALSSWMSRPTLSPLFANLSATDASAIVDHLESEGVSYELADGGSTILVPADQLYAQRLAVAAAGLPANTDGGGYSLLDEMGMTSSEFQQQVTYQRALEGELAKTIGSMNGVDTASVRLALPQETVFVDQKADPTASVFIRTKPGKTLAADQVQSIVHLVSAGIEGMSPEDVAVIDADGKVLSAVGGTAGAGLADSRTAEYETRVASGVQTMLDRVVGSGNAVVTVTADLDFDQVERRTETYSTDGDVPPLSSSTTTEEYTGSAAGGPEAGVLGPDNIAVPNDAAGGGEYRKESETVNNAVNRTVEELTSAPGSVRRQSVSVVLSQEAGAGLDLGEIEAMVAAAAGVDAERGDVVEVTRLAFDTSSAEAAQAALEQAEAAEAAAARNALVRDAAIAGGILLALAVLWFVAARRSRKARREAIDLGQLQLEQADAEDAVELEAAEPALELPTGPTQQDEDAARREDVLALAAEQPAEVAGALRGWLAGSRR